MSVDETMVARVANLAKLEVPAGDVANLTRELNTILGWVDQLQAVDTEGVEPMAAVIPIQRDWREDIVTDGDRQSDILANAPAQSHGFFAVPKVIE